MRFARPTLAIASPVFTIALVGWMLLAAFASLAQTASTAYVADGGSTTLATHPVRLATPLAPSGTTATATLATAANLSAFYDLLEQAGLRARLQRFPATYTIFAPTNEAMANMPNPLREQLHQLGAPIVKSVARVHIVAGTFTEDQLTEGRELETLSGRKLRVTHQPDGTILLDGIYQVRDNSQPTTNGVIYSIESVIVP